MAPRPFAFVLPLFVAAAAVAQTADLRLRQFDTGLSSAEQQLCASVVMPPAWRDSSNPVWFATGPTARLDMHELWVGALVPLAWVQVARGAPHLFVLGVPAGTQVTFTSSGWRPRWPAC